MVRRVVAGVLVLVVVSMAVFALFFYGPNDPAYQYCPENRCTPAKLEQIHQRWVWTGRLRSSTSST